MSKKENHFLFVHLLPFPPSWNKFEAKSTFCSYCDQYVSPKAICAHYLLFSYHRKHTHIHTKHTYWKQRGRRRKEILINFADKQRCHDSCLFFPGICNVLNGAHFINSQSEGESGNEFSWKCNFHQLKIYWNEEEEKKSRLILQINNNASCYSFLGICNEFSTTVLIS